MPFLLLTDIKLLTTEHCNGLSIRTKLYRNARCHETRAGHRVSINRSPDTGRQYGYWRAIENYRAVRQIVQGRKIQWYPGTISGTDRQSYCARDSYRPDSQTKRYSISFS